MHYNNMKPTALSLFLALAGAASGPAATQQPLNGEAIYAENCARCHETALPQMPARAALRDYTPEMIETALSSFAMRSEAAHLSHAERRAVAEFLSGRPAGSYKAPLEVLPESAYCATSRNITDPLAGRSWNGWGAGLGNTRFQAAEAAGLTRSDVPRLKLKWAFGVPGSCGIRLAGHRRRAARILRLPATAWSIRWIPRQAASPGRFRRTAAFDRHQRS